MGKRLIITEEERKNILSNYYNQKIVSEQDKNITNRIYGLIKNLPIVRKIEKTYDPDLRKHIMNLVGITPKLKGKEKEIISQIKDENMSSEELAQKLGSEITKLNKSKLNEQLYGPYVAHYASSSALGSASTIPAGWMITIPTLIFLILFIRKVLKDSGE